MCSLNFIICRLTSDSDGALLLRLPVDKLHIGEALKPAAHGPVLPLLIKAIGIDNDTREVIERRTIDTVLLMIDDIASQIKLNI